MKQLIILSLLFVLVLTKNKIDTRQLKCLVCQSVMEELDNAISKLDPTRTIEIGSYRLDDVGNLKKKTVPQTKSEVKLSEIIDEICDKMDDYVRATWKSNKQLTLIKLMGSDGKMNSDISKVDIIQDDDLNKSLKYYCEGIVEEHEENIIKLYKSNLDNIDIRICSSEAKLCNHDLPYDEHVTDEL